MPNNNNNQMTTPSVVTVVNLISVHAGALLFSLLWAAAAATCTTQTDTDTDTHTQRQKLYSTDILTGTLEHWNKTTTWKEKARENFAFRVATAAFKSSSSASAPVPVLLLLLLALVVVVVANGAHNSGNNMAPGGKWVNVVVVVVEEE